MSTISKNYIEDGSNLGDIVRTDKEKRILKLLGNGAGPTTVALAVGVTSGYVGQLLSDPVFAAEVSELRFNALQKHTEMDQRYDSMEEQLLTQLKDLLPLMMRPMEILKAIQVINGAKRRGHLGEMEGTSTAATVVQLTMPTLIMQNFTTNINNQVVQAGDQTLETIQSGSMMSAAKLRAASRAQEVLENQQDMIQARVKTLLDGGKQ